MDKSLETLLCERYPKIFSEYGLPAEKSCMHWGCAVDDGWFNIIDTLCSAIQSHIDNPPYVKKTGLDGFIVNVKQLYNLTVWNKLIYPKVNRLPYDTYKKFAKRLQFDVTPYRQSTTPIPQVVFTQVKEKFSGLRIYYSGGDDYIRALVNLAEHMSFKTCEVCGRMDNTVGRNGFTQGWQKTTCIEHTRSLNTFVKNIDIKTK